jgi:hypothetical protein
VKALESLVLLTGVVALLFVVVFPWAEPRLPFTDVTVDDEQPGADIVDPSNPSGPTVPATAVPGQPADPGTLTVDPDSPVLGLAALSAPVVGSR